jgi:exonuclease SbcD
MRGIIHALTADFGGDAVNLVVGHAMVRGGQTGGGERDAQTSFEPYWLSAAAFPPSLAYGALGHLHLAQRVPTGAPVWYSGSPVQVDFGEAGAGKHVLVVDVTPTTPAQVREVPLRAGTELRTVTGTVAELEAMEAGAFGDAWLRVRVEGPGRAGLVDDVRTWLGNRVVEVRVLGDRTAPDGRVATRQGRTPHELFDTYLAEQDIDDPRLPALFAELLAAETSA